MSEELPRPHKPIPFTPENFAQFAAGADPERISEAAHLSAQALVHRGRDNDDPEVTDRLIRLADEQGLELIAELWSQSPAHSLPGALWRLYAIRAATLRDPERISQYFKAGKERAQVDHVVAGVAEPPGANEVKIMADAILTGAFDGEFDVALERCAAFCSVVALGQALFADDREVASPEHASKLTHSAQRLARTAEELHFCARAWRIGELD